MSHVYRARDTVIERAVVVKILTEESSADPESKARFLHEAKIAGGIQHENIVSVFDYGDHGGRPYIVMEYLEGEDLRNAIRENHTGNLSQPPAHRHRHRRRSRVRPRTRHHPSRHQTRKRPHRQERQSEADGLRHRQNRQPLAHPHRHGHGHALLHGPRTSSRPRHYAAHRHLRLRHAVLRTANRSSAASKATPWSSSSTRS